MSVHTRSLVARHCCMCCPAVYSHNQLHRAGRRNYILGPVDMYISTILSDCSVDWLLSGTRVAVSCPHWCVCVWGGDSWVLECYTSYPSACHHHLCTYLRVYIRTCLLAQPYSTVCTYMQCLWAAHRDMRSQPTESL